MLANRLFMVGFQSGVVIATKNSRDEPKGRAGPNGNNTAGRGGAAASSGRRTDGAEPQNKRQTDSPNRGRTGVTQPRSVSRHIHPANRREKNKLVQDSLQRGRQEQEGNEDALAELAANSGRASTPAIDTPSPEDVDVGSDGDSTSAETLTSAPDLHSVLEATYDRIIGRVNWEVWGELSWTDSFRYLWQQGEPWFLWTPVNTTQPMDLYHLYQSNEVLEPLHEARQACTQCDNLRVVAAVHRVALDFNPTYNVGKPELIRRALVNELEPMRARLHLFIDEAMALYAMVTVHERRACTLRHSAVLGEHRPLDHTARSYNVPTLTLVVLPILAYLLWVATGRSLPVWAGTNWPTIRVPWTRLSSSYLRRVLLFVLRFISRLMRWGWTLADT